SYNEATVVCDTVARVVALGARVVVIDDGSSDDTLARLRAVPVAVLHHAVNLGQGGALQKGIDYAIAKGARFLVTFDADGQHDEADIPRMIRMLADGPLDV